MAETAGAVPATMPGPFRGRAPGKSGILYHRFGVGQLKGCRFSDFRNGSRPSSMSLGSDGTHRDRVPVQSAGYGGILAGLLVERGQRSLVRSVQDIRLIAHDQGKLGAFSDAGAGALGCRSAHVLPATHSVADFAGEGLLASGESKHAGKY